jgi:hypothetical protein
MDNAELPITIEAVAREAGVSRSWLYRQPDLRAEIERLRERTRPAAARTIPDRQRGSDASLLRRLEIATQRVRELEADNKRLRQALGKASASAAPNRPAATRRAREFHRLSNPIRPPRRRHRPQHKPAVHSHDHFGGSR